MPDGDGEDQQDRPSPADPFSLLHPAVQHHVVNTLGWRGLRPHQSAAIAPILAGHHVLVQAPTAGGKTETAVLPLLSRMVSERWGQPSVLYLCPIKALLNNLEVRLSQLAGMVGRTVGLWHGDVTPAARKRLLANRPDILLATPESIEVMLVSRMVDHQHLFRGIRAIVVDEVHAFAGDDRGWHLLALMDRVRALAVNPVQRLALSATLGNPDDLLAWFTTGRDEPRQVIVGKSGGTPNPEVTIDAVGSLSNAALVISRLHAGEKRLVFCDSRRQVEELAQGLRVLGMRTYVSHSSLSVEERRAAEHAFAEGSDCVIVATSTLELGIDVGDLDRVIQIDSPSTVSSFLQRIGRTGRRAGTIRNCLFLATDGDDLLRAVGLIRLWLEGYVEPVVPPPLPYHVLLQQLLATVLQQGGADERQDLLDSLSSWRATAGISAGEVVQVLDHLLETAVFFTDGGLIQMGPEGEKRYGARHYLELFSVFNSPELVTVIHGRQELGQVHPLSFQRADQSSVILGLAGRGWQVTHVDLQRRQAFVEPASHPGKSRWLGNGPPLSFALAQAIARVLKDPKGEEHHLSKRGKNALEVIRGEFSWLDLTVSALTPPRDDSDWVWWTFAGDRCNAAIARHLSNELGSVGSVASDALCIRLRDLGAGAGTADAVVKRLQGAVQRVATGDPGWKTVPVDLLPKFGESLPQALQEGLLRTRAMDQEAANVIAGRPIRVVVAGPP
jgi:ATP-dependent Lhr-like helicase